MTASGNSLNDSFFFLPFLSLVYFAQCNPIKGKANWSLASFLLSLAKKSITGSPELLRLLSACISISIGFAGPGRIDGNMFNSILIFFIFSKMETTLWSYIMMKGEGGAHGNCFWGKAGCVSEDSCLLLGICLLFGRLCLVWESLRQSSCYSIVQSNCESSDARAHKELPHCGGKERVYQWAKCQQVLSTHNMVNDGQ